jgi:uncharacterized membrane protein
VKGIRYLGHSIVSGVVGWGVLMLAFEGVFLAECYMARRRIPKGAK